MLAIFQYGLSVAVVGIATVFVGLVILIGLIKLLELAMGALTKKPAPKPAAPSPTPKPASTPAPAAPSPAPEPEEEEDDAVIAAIAAAVACALQAAGQDPAAYAISSVRRRGTSAWGRAGREEQVYSRM